MKLLILFFSSFFITLFLLPYLIKYLIKFNINDVPGGRRIHTNSTPRMGGIVIVFVASILFLIAIGDLNSTRLLIISTIILSIGGIIDDVRGMNYTTKFFFQIISGIFLLAHFQERIISFSLISFEIPYLIGWLIALLIIVGIFNSINMMDGLDGLVNSSSLMLFLIIAGLSYLQSNLFIITISVILMGTILAFMKYNSYPARVFLGDTGSQFIALMIIISLFDVTLRSRGGNLDFALILIFLGLPVIDTLKVFLLRLLKGNNPFLPDNSHLHHILLKTNIKHRNVVFLIQLFMIPFILAGFAYYLSPSVYHLFLFIPISFFLLYAGEIISFLVSSRKFYIAFQGLKRVLIGMRNLTFKLFPIIFFISSLLIYLTNIPVDLTPDTQIVLFLAIVFFFLTALLIYENRKSGFKRPFYIYLNLLLFFLLGETDIFGLAVQDHLHLINSKMLFYAAILSLMVLVIYFLLLRDDLLPRDSTFLSGLDLTVIPFIIFMIAISSFVFTSLMIGVIRSFVVSYILYMAYKIYFVKYNKLLNTVYYSSLIPLVAYLISILL